MGRILEELLFRWMAAAALLVGVYNPSEFSFYSWMMRADAQQTPYLITVGVILTVVLFVFARATMDSLGWVGTFALTILFLAIGWSLFNLGWIDMHEHNVLLYLAVAAAGFVLAIGSYWATIRRRFSGQVELLE